MKKLVLVLLVAIFSLSTFQGCKKGENDPSISFKSRNARLRGEWLLTKIEGTTIEVKSGTTNTITITYDGTTLKKVQTLFGSSEQQTGTYDMTIEKDGKMSWNETITKGSPAVKTNYSGSGNWQWLDEKDKKVVSLSGEKESLTVIHFFTEGNWAIDRLASKELIIIDESSSDVNGNTETNTFKFTFEKK